MLHNKHKNVIIVPNICFLKIPQHEHVFPPFAVCLDPCHHSDTVSKFTVSQWDQSSMFGYHDHVSTGSSQRDYESQ